MGINSYLSRESYFFFQRHTLRRKVENTCTDDKIRKTINKQELSETVEPTRLARPLEPE